MKETKTQKKEEINLDEHDLNNLVIIMDLARSKGLLLYEDMPKVIPTYLKLKKMLTDIKEKK